MKGFAMKKIFLLVILSLPLVGFCDSLIEGARPTGVYLFRYISFDKTPTKLNVPYTAVRSEDELFSVYSSSTFGFKVSLRHTTSGGDSYTILVPSLTSSPSGLSITITNAVMCSTNGVAFQSSPLNFSSVASLYRSAAMLFSLGYRGPAVEYFLSGNANYCVNVNYPLLVSDVLSSTNTAYRSALLSSLSSIGSGVQSIQSDVSGILGLLSSFPSSSSSWTYDQVTNFAHSCDLGPFFGFDFNTQRILDLMDRSKYDNSPTGQFLYDTVSSSISRGLPSLVESVSSLGLLDGVNSDSPLSELGKSFNRSIDNALTGGDSGGGGIAGDIKRLSTNDWTKGVRDQLRDNHDNITNRLAHMFDDAPNSAGRAIRQAADNTAVSAARATDIASKLNGTIHVQVDNPDNIGVVLDGPVMIDTTQFNGVSVPLSGLKDRIDTWYNDWYSFWDISTPAYSWSNFYNMIREFEDQNHGDLSAITNSLRGVFSVTGDVSRIYDYLSGSQSNLLEVIASSITNNWDDYYFQRFRRANEFNDEDDQPFTLESASETVFGRGFDEGEYSRLNWFSRVELLLFQLSAVSSGTNALESVDIEDELNDTVDSFNQHGQDFVNASRRVVGVFQLIDGFAASMRAAFGSFSNPVTHGITLLPAGSWIGDHALVLEVSVTIQNALRLVFQCIWYLSAFVIAWRVVVATWSRVVSFVRWLWSVFDI